VDLRPWDHYWISKQVSTFMKISLNSNRLTRWGGRLDLSGFAASMTFVQPQIELLALTLTENMALPRERPRENSSSNSPWRFSPNTPTHTFHP
jgi:hypothetical protein